VEQVFFEPLPLIVQQVAEHAGVIVESFLSEARTAAIQRALSGPEAPTDRVTLAKDMDSCTCCSKLYNTLISRHAVR